MACDALQNINNAANKTGKKSPILERGLFSPINATKIIKTISEIDNGIMAILKFEKNVLIILWKSEFELSFSDTVALFSRYFLEFSFNPINAVMVYPDIKERNAKALIFGDKTPFWLNM